MLEVTDSDATTLTTILVSFFEKTSIPLQNIVGYASDTTNVMFAEHHSVVSLLKQKIPHLFTMKCLCHSAHLCASHDCHVPLKTLSMIYIRVVPILTLVIG